MDNILLETIIFIIAILLCFYLPGKLFLRYLKIKPYGIEDIFLSLTTGLSLFTLLLYLLSWIKSEWIAIPIFLITAFLAVRKKFVIPQIQKKEYIPILFIIISTIIFSFPLLLYGIHDNSIAYRFDDLWHLALIQEMKVHFPPDIPTYAGTQLMGYHFFSDFILAKISNLFHISPFTLFFQLFSVFMSLLWGLGVYTLMHAWTKKVSVALWAVFLTMFGGSFAYIMHWLGYTSVNLQDGLRMLQPATSLYNPPYTLSVILLFYCLTLLYKYLTTKEKRWLIPFIITAGILPMVKVYAGIILYSGLMVITVYELIKKRYFILQVLICIVIIFAITYGIFVWGKGGLIWHPLWAPHQMLIDIFGSSIIEKFYTYYKFNVISKIIELETLGLFLFLIANLGTRIFGILMLLILLKNKKMPSIFSISVAVMLIASVLIPLLFIQTGKVFEMIQMTNYYLMFCSLFAAIGISVFFSLHFPYRKFIILLISIIFIGLTCPSAVYMQKNMIINSYTKTSLNEPYFHALLFLRERGNYNDTLLELPNQKIMNNTDELYKWNEGTNPISSVLANKRVYLANVGITFYDMDIQKRLNNLFLINKQLNTPREATLAKNLLIENNIRYILTSYPLRSLSTIKGIKQIYNENSYHIYEITSL